MSITVLSNIPTFSFLVWIELLHVFFDLGEISDLVSGFLWQFQSHNKQQLDLFLEFGGHAATPQSDGYL
jgi:hypothetical protein